MKKIFGWIFINLIVLFFFGFSCLRSTRENRLTREGNILVGKIENFREKNKRLPVSLDEMGIKEKEGVDALYYDKRDSFHYTISFGISMDYNKFYYSDSKTWENGYRAMK